MDKPGGKGKRGDETATIKFRPAELLLSQAEASLAAGRVREACDSFQDVLRMDPGNERARAVLDELGKSSVQVTQPLPRLGKAVMMLERAASHALAGRLDDARDCYDDVLAGDPNNADARSGLEALGPRLIERARADGLSDDRRVEVAVSRKQLDREIVNRPRLSSSAAFVLSMLARRPATVGELIAQGSLSEAEVLDLLREFVRSGVLRLS